ncbi:unnamed protein product [Toxocara canis]|uniref:Deltameth_res domain-containing protein n=1 Tax=Toxocara canis TaxID=6265 RepID=A0A183TX62_TOXCA|nr:unnamed protein product [Toxocara canis]
MTAVGRAKAITIKYWAGVEVSKEDRRDAYSDLYMYAIGLFILLLVYAVYNGFELYVTYKYYETLPPESFVAVKPPDSRPPRPPPPPFNRNFKADPSGKYKYTIAQPKS